MSILIDEHTKVLIQGITGSEGRFHTEQMQNYGTNIKAGVTPGRGGREIDNIPVYNSISEALKNHTIDASVIFVPAKFARDAILEAIRNEIGLVVCITEHIPVHDVMPTYHYLTKCSSSILIGPNCPGLISPGKSKLGIMPGPVFSPGTVGMISRSGTLTYEIADNLTNRGLGQSTVIGIGGDQIIGANFTDFLIRFERDPDTDLVVLVGEIGGTEEEQAAQFIAKNMTTPVVSYIAGFSAPRGKRMGHAGAIISGERGTAESKAKTLESLGVSVGRTPRELAELAADYF